MSEAGNEKIMKVTGRSLKQWEQLVDKHFPSGAGHSEVARYLRSVEGLESWWAQQITVLLERKSGKRLLGQCADGTFQIGVSRTFPLPLAELWSIVISRKASLLFTRLEVREGCGQQLIEYTISSYKDRSHLRMRWKPEGWKEAAIVQLRLTAKGAAKTTVTVHQEKLPSQELRGEMKRFWTKRLEELAQLIKKGEHGETCVNDPEDPFGGS